MATTLLIDGASVDLTDGHVIPTHLNLSFREMDTFTFQVRCIAVPDTDPYMGKVAQVSINGTQYFAGNISRRDLQDTAKGYVFQYTALSLRDRGDWFPVTDSNTGIDLCKFNLSADDPDYVAARAGRNVGEIIKSILTMTTNAANLSAGGINYASLSPPTLPSDTLSDLAAMTLIPPFPCFIQGEKILGAIEGFLQSTSVNIGMWIQPWDGTLRFLDMRNFAAHTFTLGTDPIEVFTPSRDISDCFQRVIVRGQPLILPVHVSLSEGSLTENFAHDALSSSAAKAAWHPSDWSQPSTAQDNGTCTCPSTTTVTVTSAHSTYFWVSNFWDQNTGAHGVIYLNYSAGTGINQITSRRIVSNTSLSAGGTSTLTLDFPLAATNYTSYWIHGETLGANIVWRKYSVVNTAIGNAMANYFNFPVPWINSSNTLAELVQTPTASICYSSSGAAPYTEVPLQMNIDPVSSTILFMKPTSLVFGGGSTTTPPNDIRVLLAVNQGSLTATRPADVSGVAQYEGTSHTQDGMSKTLVVTIDQWKDPLNQANMNSFAQDYLDSVKDTCVEGTLVYYGLYEPALTFGTAINVTGDTFTTGWESCTSFSGHEGMNVVDVELEWVVDGDGGTYHVTTMHCSNRRAHFSADNFLKPPRGYVPLGTESGTFSARDGYSDDDSGNQQYFNRMLGIGKDGNAESVSNLIPKPHGVPRPDLSGSNPMDGMGNPMEGLMAANGVGAGDPFDIPTTPMEFLDAQGIDPTGGFGFQPGGNNLRGKRTNAERRAEAIRDAKARKARVQRDGPKGQIKRAIAKTKQKQAEHKAHVAKKKAKTKAFKSNLAKKAAARKARVMRDGPEARIMRARQARAAENNVDLNREAMGDDD